MDPIGDLGDRSEELSRPSRVLELLRRVLFISCLLAGSYLTFMPADQVLRVEVVDFAKQLKAKAKRFGSGLRGLEKESGAAIDPSINRWATMPLEQYVAEETKGRLVDVPADKGEPWTRLFDDAAATLAGRGSGLDRYVGQAYNSYFLYFPADYAPLDSLKDRLAQDSMLYVRQSGAAPLSSLTPERADRYLNVLRQFPSDVRGAPAAVLYPRRAQGGWFILGALACYFLLPWYRPGRRELAYARAGAVVVPDLMGAALAAVLFTLPILIISSNSPGGPVRMWQSEGGWSYLVAICWGFGGFFLVINLVALWYACSSIHLLEGGLRCFSLGGGWVCRYADIQRVEPKTYDMPQWLRRLMFVASLFNPRVAGPVLLARAGHGIRIRRRDGQTLKLLLTRLPGAWRIIQEMQAAGVEIDPQIAQAFEVGPARPEPDCPGHLALPLWSIILLAVFGGGAFAAYHWPSQPVKVVRNLRFSDQALAQRVKLTEQMMKVSRQMTQALEQSRTGTPQQRAEAMKEFERLQEQYSQLDRQHEAIQPDEEE